MLFEVKTKIQGIPCLIQVEEYQPGSFSPQAASDIDYYGVCDYVICDRKGYAAPWLKAKVTAADEDRIMSAIEGHVRRERQKALEDHFFDARGYA